MKTKIVISIFLLLILGSNFYLSKFHPDIFTKAKIQLSQINGSSSYLGRLNLWHLLVQNNDWQNAAILESKLNQDQVQNYKLAYQPQELQKRLSDLQNNPQKSTDDYVEIARIQSILGLSNQTVDSIKKAHQLDPVRSDVDRLFYQTLK
jgi:hypothetical protein